MFYVVFAGSGPLPVLMPTAVQARPGMSIRLWMIFATYLLKLSTLLRLRGDPRWIHVLKLAKVALLVSMSKRRQRRTRLPSADLALINDAEFEARCRFNRDHFQQLADALTIPDYRHGGHNFSGTKCLFMLMNRLSYPCRNWQVAELMGISPDYASRLINYTARMLLLKWGHLLAFTENKFPPATIAKYCSLLCLLLLT
jgi:hypothetical protein